MTLVTKAEIVRRLGLSRPTVTKLVDAGVLPRPLRQTKLYCWERVEAALRAADGGEPPGEGAKA